MNTIENEITLKDVLLKCKEWLMYFVSKWVLIFTVCVIGAVIGIFFAVRAEYTYSAKLSFVIEDDKAQGGLTGALGLASQFGVDLGGGSSGSAFSGANLLELMKSRSLIEKTLLTNVQIGGGKKTLAEAYIEMQQWREKWEGKNAIIGYFIENNREKFTLQQDSILGLIHSQILQSYLSIKQRDKRLGIIDAIVTSPNEQFSKKFVEVLVEVVSTFYIETKTKKTASNVSILERQTDSIRYQLNSAIGGVAQGLDATYNLNPAMSVSRLQPQKRQIDVQANTAILIELTKNLELAKISLRKETPLIQVIDYPILPLDKQKLGKRKGAMMGGGIGALLIFIYLIIIRVYKQLFQ